MYKNYFDKIDTETKAYFLGLILADGWVTKNRRVLGIALLESDNDILYLFKKELESDHKIQTRTKARKHPLSRLEISCTHLVKSLNKLGIFSDKSLKATLPNISNEYMPHLLRGLFDGDGSFANLRQPVLASSSKQLLDDINQWLAVNLGMTCSIYASTQGDITSYKLAINLPNAELIHVLYPTNCCGISRKIVAAEKYKELIKSKVKGLG